jgi:predicted PurR-regulated permease PerM
VAVFSPPTPANRTQGAGFFLAGAGVFVALLYYGRAFCVTLLISVILAFLLEPFVALIVRLRVPRGGAAFLVCTIALLVLYLVGFAIVSQASSIADDLPAYSERVNKIVDRAADRMQVTEQTIYRLIVPKRFQDTPAAPEQQPPPKRSKRRSEPPPPSPPPAVQEVRIKQERSSLLNNAYDYASSLYNVILMGSFVPFLVFFMLSWQDQLRKRFLSLFEGQDRSVAGRTLQSIGSMARAYVVGNFILGLILSSVSAFCFWTWHLPHWEVVGVVSGFLSLVPYIGLPLAIIPAFASALMMYNGVTPYVVISAEVGFFHLLALNLLYPAVVGARVHLNPLTVTVALMFWGSLWGGIGLVLAIPITAGAKAVFDNIEGLQPYGRLLGD